MDHTSDYHILSKGTHDFCQCLFYVFSFHSNKKDSSNLFINKCKLYLRMLVFGN